MKANSSSFVIGRFLFYIVVDLNIPNPLILLIKIVVSMRARAQLIPVSSSSTPCCYRLSSCVVRIIVFMY